MKDNQGCPDLHQVRYLKGYLSSDRLRMVCLFEAPDAESVRIVNRQVGMPYERIWTAQSMNRSNESLAQSLNHFPGGRCLPLLSTFNDVDGHLLELIARINSRPAADIGVVSLAE